MTGSPRRILTSQDMSRALKRMAHEVLERNKGGERLVLMGVRTRGVPLAARLGAAVEAIEGVAVPVGSLDVNLYRDDYASAGPRPLGPTHFPGPIDGQVVVLVDDVLFTGRTIRAALDALIDNGRPLAIQLAVLVDRGHRELPIRPDYIGKNVPTAADDQVRVRLVEVDGVDEVVVAPAAGEEAG